jgi:hypothetical protein
MNNKIAVEKTPHIEVTNDLEIHDLRKNETETEPKEPRKRKKFRRTDVVFNFVDLIYRQWYNN